MLKKQLKQRNEPFKTQCKKNIWKTSEIKLFLKKTKMNEKMDIVRIIVNKQDKVTKILKKLFWLEILRRESTRKMKIYF